jgi:hypothetical protein
MYIALLTFVLQHDFCLSAREVKSIILVLHDGLVPRITGTCCSVQDSGQAVRPTVRCWGSRGTRDFLSCGTVGAVCRLGYRRLLLLDEKLIDVHLVRKFGIHGALPLPYSKWTNL